MSSDALLWNALPPPRKPRPAEHIWSLRKNGRQRDGELRGHGEWGWEFQLLEDGELVYGRRWTMRAEAFAEAEAKRQELERDGWTVLS